MLALNSLEIYNQRLRSILDNLHPEFSSNELSLRTFASNLNIPEPTRAVILFLAIKARYPDEKQFDLILNFLRYNSYETAIGHLIKNSSKADLARKLVPSNSLLTDISRYASIPEMSGIPRVVKNFVTSKAAIGISAGVWANGVFGPVGVSQNGKVIFSRKIWGKVPKRKIYWHLRKLFFDRSRKLASTFIYKAVLYLILKTNLDRILLRSSQLPKSCYIINPKSFSLLEIPSYSTQEMLKVWSQSLDMKYDRALVHDLLPMTHPNFFRLETFQEHIKYVDLLKQFSTLIVATPILKRELESMLDGSVYNSQIKVLALPSSFNKESLSAANNTSEQNFVFIGGYYSRKGLAKLVDLLDEFDESEINFTVSVIGTPNPLLDSYSELLYARIKSRPQVYKAFSPLPESKLTSLISNSLGVLYLSEAEGYGLPIIEALALNKIVVVINNELNTYFKELYGGIHLLDTPFSNATMIELCEIARKGKLFTEIKASLQHSLLPLDVNRWAERFIAI
jgi:hypothetical protein